MLFRSAPFRPWLFGRAMLPPRTIPFSWDRATEQYVTATAGTPYDAYSMFDDAHSVAGNKIVTKLVWSPSGNALSIGADGIPYMEAAASGRQSADYREWSVATNAYVPVTGAGDGYTATYYINNQAPTEIGVIPTQQAYTNIAFTGPVVTAYVNDTEGDALTFSNFSVGGLSIDAVTIEGQPAQRIQGTPTTVASNNVTLRVTDALGDYVDLTLFVLNVGLGVQVPQSDTSMVLATFLALLDAAGIGYSTQPETGTGVTIGNVVGNSPAYPSYVPVGSSIIVGYSVAVSAVPDVVGSTSSGATATLRGYGYNATYSYVDSSVVPSGRVISQDPAAGQELVVGNSVSLVISGISPQRMHRVMRPRHWRT